MLEAAKSVLLILSALFPIVNPLGGSPVFLALTQDYPAPARRLLARKVAINSFILLIASFLIGSHILDFFGISIPVVQVGGGLTTDAEIAEALTWGARRVVIGSVGALDAELVARLVARHGADRLAVGIDARNGRVAPRGSKMVLDVSTSSPSEGAGFLMKPPSTSKVATCPFRMNRASTSRRRSVIVRAPCRAGPRSGAP